MRSGGDRWDCNRSRGTDIARGADPREAVVRTGGAVVGAASTDGAAVGATSATSSVASGATGGSDVAFSTPSEVEGTGNPAAASGTAAAGAEEGAATVASGAAAAIRAAIDVGADLDVLEPTSPQLLLVLLLLLSPPSMSPLF